MTSYHPLAHFRRGPWRTQNQPPPPFADSSCRREPDFEHPFPAITGLCRKNKTRTFAVGERVAYFTVRRPHRLTAILRIEASFRCHEEAAEWYRAQSLNLPRNVMVTGNGPLDWQRTRGFYSDKGARFAPTDERSPQEVVSAWDALYAERRLEAPHVHVCRALFVNVHDPPLLTDEGAMRVFPDRRFPGTQTPKRVEEPVIDALARELGLHLPK